MSDILVYVPALVAVQTAAEEQAEVRGGDIEVRRCNVEMLLWILTQ